MIQEGVDQLEMGDNDCVPRGGQWHPGGRPGTSRGYEFLPELRASACLMIVDRSYDLEKGRMMGPEYHSWACLTVAMTTSCGAHEDIPFTFI